jgi:hypothetical protein
MKRLQREIKNMKNLFNFAKEVSPTLKRISLTKSGHLHNRLSSLKAA